jgi:hypothetical protein
MSDPIKVSRRAVLAGVPATALLTLAQGQAAPPAGRPRIAVLATEYRKLSHAEVIVDRFLEGFGWESEHHHPQVDIVSLYVDQFPEGDLSRERASRFPHMKIYPTIAAALTCGGAELAVDGVVIIGEHGNYPNNEKGQTLYPRYEFFQQTVDVFRKSKRGVPVFNDKHLSWKWDWAKQMVDTANSMGFPLMAGSSVPLTYRIPSIEMPLGAEIEEALAIGPGNIDSYDFHALETIQCFVERRKGGETGVVRLQALRGDAVWKAMSSGSWGSGGWDPALLEACLCRSHMLKPAREGFSHVYPSLADLKRIVSDPIVYRFEYADGLKATMFLASGLLDDITFAARLKGQAQPFSTQMYLAGSLADTQPHHFSALVWQIEQLFLSGKSQYPIERTLLTTGLVATGMDSLFRKGERLDTPQLAIRYQPTAQSTFRRT